MGSVGRAARTNAISQARLLPLRRPSSFCVRSRIGWICNETALLHTGGTWEDFDGNANVVPFVVNGMVFMASNKQLAIFGVKSQ
jgi:hypothetical protein